MNEPRRLRLAVAAAFVCFAVPPVMGLLAPDALAAFPGRATLALPFLPVFILGALRGWRGGLAGTGGGVAALLLVALLVSRPDVRVDVLWMAALLVLVGGAGTLSNGILHRSRMKAEERALSDPGTGIPNRRHGLLHLERAFAAARRGSEMAVVIFDLDRFKRVNDEYGHATGDEVLRQFARVLTDRTREMNLSARLGGEEFVSILESCDAEGAVLFAEGVREALAKVRFSFGGVTASAGVAAYEPGMASPDVLLAAADQALYRAKEGGRDRVEVASGGGGEKVKEAVTLSRIDLGSAADRAGSGELILVVDDDDDTRRSLTRALRRSGYDVLETGDPTRATRIVQGLERPIDLVITDILMPAMSGFRMVEHLSRESGPLRVLYISGYVQDEIEWSGAPGGVTGFLQKPATLDELRRSISAMLDKDPRRGSTSDVSGADREGRASATPGRTPGPSEPRRPIVLTSTGEDGLRALRVRFQHLGWDDLVALPLDGNADVDVDGDTRLLAAWLDGPALDEALERVEELRSRLATDAPPPVLLVSERLPPEVAGRWPDLFPALYVPSDTGLGELDLQVEHLLATRERLTQHRATRLDMEARIEASTAELEAAYGDLVMRLSRTCETRDGTTGRHGERVGETARALAIEMGLPAPEAEVIGQAAALHDIGKIAVPDAILDKPGELTPTERELVKRHTVIGADLLTGSRHPILQEAERIARSHHERWDGTGYPDGLAGEEIPRSARIVAVADVFDVVTHARSYVEASSAERALGVIMEGRGTFFDPDVVTALAALDRRGVLTIDPDRAPVAPRDASPRSPIEIQALLEELTRS